MTTVEATVYSGTKEGELIEGKETFTAGNEKTPHQGPSNSHQRPKHIRSLILDCAVPTYIHYFEYGQVLGT